MSKRKNVRSNHRTARPARYRLFLKRKEARKRAKYRRRIYTRIPVAYRPQSKGA